MKQDGEQSTIRIQMEIKPADKNHTRNLWSHIETLKSMNTNIVMTFRQKLWKVLDQKELLGLVS